jgi:uncharacterized peroxidase-related enzyme
LQATGRLKALYARVETPDGHVDNIMTAHSLRPASLEGHMALYKNVLHHKANVTPKWVLEMIGVYVSLLNRCRYCVDHHYEGLKRLIDDAEKSSAIRNALDAALKSGAVETSALSAKEIASLNYAAKLTTAPAAIDEADIEKLRAAGAVDEEILEINQVTAYFSYANRTVLGLGVTTDGDTLGLSPNNNADGNDWGHQ